MERTNLGNGDPDAFLIQCAEAVLETEVTEHAAGMTYKVKDRGTLDLNFVGDFLNHWPSGTLPQYVGKFEFTNLGCRKYRVTRR